jgi:hypothetical protein
MVAEEACQGGTEVGAALYPGAADRTVPSKPRQQLAVTGRGVGDLCRVKAAPCLVDQTGRQGVFVAVDPAEYWTTSMWSRDDGRAARRHASG